MYKGKKKLADRNGDEVVRLGRGPNKMVWIQFVSDGKKILTSPFCVKKVPVEVALDEDDF